jgi:hypothetical protein
MQSATARAALASVALTLLATPAAADAAAVSDHDSVYVIDGTSVGACARNYTSAAVCGTFPEFTRLIQPQPRAATVSVAFACGLGCVASFAFLALLLLLVGSILGGYLVISQARLYEIEQEMIEDQRALPR